MNRVLGIFIAVSLCASAVASVAFAQQPQAANQRAIEIVQQRIFQGPEGVPMPPPPPGADFVWIATENFSGKTVKGAPYSAEAVTESVQTLADGNRIVNKFTSQVYRDSEGRTRREQTLKALGPVGTGEEPLQTTFINDPVTGTSYSLDSRTHTAHKSMPFNFQIMTKSGKPGEGNTFEFKSAQGAGATSNVIVTVPAGPGQPGTRVPPPGVSEHFEVRTEGAAGFAIRTRPSPGNEVKEQLGKQMIEGVEAEGTRTTVTIPAGEIGNERPIEIVSERWYSAELQLVVMTRHSDPRSGETTYKLTNINRAEPAKSLFEVPSGFTIREMKFGEPSIAPLPRKKLANPE
ncbi:MAG TPA: hypothetical protein VN844_26480 [Pyrinomonadaceae bacterium]|nr:hypothetical protein [Pyrinomonadaceae bacterium]